MIRKLIIRILKFIEKKKLKICKKVILEKRVKFTLNSFFEGKNKINKNSIIDNSKIGFATYIGHDCVFTNTTIGKYCSIANNVKVINATHPTNKFVSTHPAFFSTRKQAGFTYVKEQLFNELKYIDEKDRISVIIGNDVWIGEDVTILGGVKIGDGAIIGTGAIVTHDVEPYSINAGIPSKKIKYRFEKDEIEFLENLKWWDKSEEWIMKNINNFQDIKEFVNKKGKK